MSSTSTALINGMLRKEKAFREDIEWNQTNVMGFAARLAPGGTLEGLLSSNDDNDGSSSSSNSVMQKYRQALKDLAQDNVDKERQLTAYMTAVKKLDQQEEKDSGGNGAGEDIQAKLERAVQTERQALDLNSIPVTQEASYLELCTELGENQGFGGGIGDDDIAIVNMGGADSNEHSLKCPLTAALMEDPVKNKVCKHSYSRQAILQHIQSQQGRGRCLCPVAGCTNKTLNASQLEDDKLTATLVRRLKKRQQLSQKSQHSAVQVDEDDDEEYDE